MQIEALSTALVGAALDAAELRHRVIAANIANAGAAGYARQTVSFEAQMDALSGTGLPAAPEVVPAQGPGGEPMPVRLDQEAVDMAANSLQYQALLKALSRHYGVLQSAVTEGKR